MLLSLSSYNIFQAIASYNLKTTLRCKMTPVNFKPPRTLVYVLDFFMPNRTNTMRSLYSNHILMHVFSDISSFVLNQNSFALRLLGTKTSVKCFRFLSSTLIRNHTELPCANGYHKKT